MHSKDVLCSPRKLRCAQAVCLSAHAAWVPRPATTAAAASARACARCAAARRGRSARCRAARPIGPTLQSRGGSKRARWPQGDGAAAQPDELPLVREESEAIAEAAVAGRGQGVRTYVLRPVDGRLRYTRRGREARGDEGQAVQDADVELDALSLHLASARPPDTT